MNQPPTKPMDLGEVLSQVNGRVEANRKSQENGELTIKDLRRLFDQESAKMNQAIFNEQTDQVRESCLNTVAILVEILARS